MEIDIQKILQKVQAKLGELEMQLIIAQSTIEHLQAQVAKNEASPEPELEEQ